MPNFITKPMCNKIHAVLPSSVGKGPSRALSASMCIDQAEHCLLACASTVPDNPSQAKPQEQREWEPGHKHIFKLIREDLSSTITRGQVNIGHAAYPLPILTECHSVFSWLATDLIAAPIELSTSLPSFSN